MASAEAAAAITEADVATFRRTLTKPVWRSESPQYAPASATAMKDMRNRVAYELAVHSFKMGLQEMKFEVCAALQSMMTEATNPNK